MHGPAMSRNTKGWSMWFIVGEDWIKTLSSLLCPKPDAAWVFRVLRWWVMVGSITCKEAGRHAALPEDVRTTTDMKVGPCELLKRLGHAAAPVTSPIATCTEMKSGVVLPL